MWQIALKNILRIQLHTIVKHAMTTVRNVQDPLTENANLVKLPITNNLMKIFAMINVMKAVMNVMVLIMIIVKAAHLLKTYLNKTHALMNVQMDPMLKTRNVIIVTQIVGNFQIY